MKSFGPRVVRAAADVPAAACRPDSSAVQPADLQRAQVPSAVVLRRRATVSHLPGIDRRRRAGPQHHRGEFLTGSTSASSSIVNSCRRMGSRRYARRRDRAAVRRHRRQMGRTPQPADPRRGRARRVSATDPTVPDSAARWPMCPKLKSHTWPGRSSSGLHFDNEVIKASERGWRVVPDIRCAGKEVGAHSAGFENPHAMPNRLSSKATLSLHPTRPISSRATWSSAAP
jgi:hypothetical protein